MRRVHTRADVSGTKDQSSESHLAWLPFPQRVLHTRNSYNDIVVTSTARKYKHTRTSLQAEVSLSHLSRKIRRSSCEVYARKVISCFPTEIQASNLGDISTSQLPVLV